MSSLSPSLIRIAGLLGLFSMLSFGVACDSKKDRGSAVAPSESGEGAASGDDEFVAGSKADVFTFGLAADPETFDPASMSGAPEGRIAFQIFEGLMMPGPTTEGLSDASKVVVPGVASGYERSEDGLTYTFKIREDAKWSDGKRLTAEDFVWSWKRILTPGFPADYAQMLWVIKGAEAYNKGELKDWEDVGITAPDDTTLQVTLERPTPYFPELAAFYTFFPTPRHVIEEHGDRWTRPQNIVTNGPYKVAGYKEQQEIAMELNEHYWEADNVKIKKARARIIPDANARVNAYKTGELHWSGAGLPVAQITSLLTHPDYMQEPMLGVYYYRLNVSQEDSPLNNPKVRQALSLAIDRESLVSSTMNGLFEVAESYVPSMAGYSSTTSTGYDVKKARQLLADAGFEKGEGFPEVELLYNTDENHKLVAEAIQDMWKRNLGVDITLNNKEWKTYLQDIDSLNYQVARAGWIGDYNDPMTFLDMWLTDNGNNDTGWSDEEYDGLIAQAQAEVDLKERTKILQKAEEILLDRGPVIPIYFYTNNILRARQIEGFGAHNRDIHLLKYMALETP